MAKGRSLRSAPIVTRSRAAALYSPASRLPPELVTEILEYLYLEDLWLAAAVSRAFYAAARRAGIYIHRKIRWTNLDDCAADITTFREIVQHFLQQSLLLSFSFTYYMEDEREPEKRVACYEKMRPQLLELLALVTDALPILVFLELEIPDYFGPIMDGALRHPAPRLAELNLTRAPLSGPCTHIVSVDLFVGDAPKLRDILLRDVPLGAEPVRAFAPVEFAAFDYAEAYPDIDFPRHFPRLENLRLAFFTEDHAAPPYRFKLEGLSLKKLIIDDARDYPLTPSLERSIKLGDIPTIAHVASDVTWTEPLWQPNSKDPISARLTHYEMLESDISVHVVPQHRKWRRTFHLHTWYPSDHCPLASMPKVSERLTYLRMDNLYLVGLLECDSLLLNALRELQIDFESEQKRATMLWPPDWFDTLTDEEVSFDEADRSTATFAKESYRYISCGNLETLTLFAMDTAMHLDSQEAAFLGRALGQTSRRQKERAALDLIGIEFRKPVADALLNKTYSAIRHYEFAGYDSRADYDNGLWDEEI